MSDVELAHETVLDGKPGFLILAGTGSIALAKDPAGRWRRAGGLGPAAGDEGSGFWIGREYALRRGRRLFPVTPEGVRKTAALAAGVLRGASRDPLKAEIVSRAQDHLVATLMALIPKGDGLLTVGTAGGLFEDGNFRKGFFRRLRAALPGRRLVAKAARKPAAASAARRGLWRPGLSHGIIGASPRRT
jgi:N-acetylglucosamine kinase-like BadF-type ATPase